MCNEPHPICHSGGHTPHSAAMHLVMIPNTKNICTSCKALQMDLFFSGLALLHHAMYVQCATPDCPFRWAHGPQCCNAPSHDPKQRKYLHIMHSTSNRPVFQWAGSIAPCNVCAMCHTRFAIQVGTRPTMLQCT
jgi:hypothetical protein